VLEAASGQRRRASASASMGASQRFRRKATCAAAAHPGPALRCPRSPRCCHRPLPRSCCAVESQPMQARRVTDMTAPPHPSGSPRIAWLLPQPPRARSRSSLSSCAATAAASAHPARRRLLRSVGEGPASKSTALSLRGCGCRGCAAPAPTSRKTRRSAAALGYFAANNARLRFTFSSLAASNAHSGPGSGAWRMPAQRRAAAAAAARRRSRQTRVWGEMRPFVCNLFRATHGAAQNELYRQHNKMVRQRCARVEGARSRACAA
jgi:hypothetical protein